MFNPKTVPVHGIRKLRGGNGAFRRMRTTAERRMSQIVDGEPPPRAARNLHNLPQAWDDHLHHRERTWKVHGKRCKAWAR